MKKLIRLVLIATIVMVFSVAGTCQAFAVQKLQTGDESISLETVEKAKAASPSKMSQVSRVADQKVKLVNAKSGVKISWNKVKGATKYAIYKKKTTGWVKIKVETDTTFVDTKAKAGKSNTYAVKTKINGKYSVAKKASIVYLKTPDITLTAKKNGISISWDKVAGAKKYVVYKKSPGESKFK